MRKRSPGYAVSLLLAGAVPLAAQDAVPLPDLRFGVMTHFAHGWDPASIPAVARSGVGGVRDEVYWREVERERQKTLFPARYDQTMQALAQARLSPLVVLSFENDNYDGGATPYTDEGIAAYARYGAEVLRHYGNAISAVEVWNEFNGGFVRGPAENDRANHYLRLLRATQAEVKRSRPDVTIVGGATAGVPLPYWEKLFAGGALAWMDAVSVHPYRQDLSPEGLETDMAELAALIAKYNGGRAKPIWVTEIGWQTATPVGPGDLALDENVQAWFLVRAYALLLSAGVERIYWYLFRDYEDFKMGLVHDDEALTPKPAFQAMATLVQQLRGARFVAKDATPPEIYSIRFRRGSGEDVRVMWSLEPREFSVAGVSSIVDLFGKPVEFDGRLRLSEAPVFVAGDARELPAPTETVIADARKGFSGAQRQNGWSYGYMLGSSGDFQPLPTFAADDWHTAWGSEHPFLSVTSTDQHPSFAEGGPVATVRRWQSDREGVVHIAGSFHGGKYGGDGVGVAIAVNGQRRFRKVLGGGEGRAVAEFFDFVETVQTGTTVDFIVDPGPAANIDYDSTRVAATISTRP